jgi:serine/threonine-protein kinase RsbW
VGPGQASEAFAITLPSGEASVEAGRLALIEYLEPLALDAKVLNRIEVVLEELVSNVVRHATQADLLSIAAQCRGDAVVLAVEDDGQPFNPLEAAEHAGFTSLDDAPLGGLGIPLIRRLSRSVRYDRIGTMNRLTVEIAIA